MHEPPWKALVIRLRDEGYESQYLDRLRTVMPVESHQTALEHEIRQEMASALGRTEAKVNAALLELELAERALEKAVSDAEIQTARTQFVTARGVALQARLDLRIHREALGIRQNPELELRYPIPSIPWKS